MAKYPFKKGDYVVYGIGGVCQIEEVGDLSFGASTGCYYTLRPITDQSSLIFVPCDNEALASKIRYLLPKESIDRVLKAHLSSPIAWENDRKLRLALFHDILAKAEPIELLSMVRCLLLKRIEFEQSNRKLSLSDSETLQKAMHSIQSEFSFSLGISVNEVQTYIRSQLGREAIL